MTLTFDSHDQRYIAELTEYVAIASNSREADRETMVQAAQWLANQISFANGRVEETAGWPVVRGEWLGKPDAPTILVYGHYDVQPTGDLAEWNSEPYSLVVKDDRMYGRGVTDDKGPVLVVLKTMQAFIEQEGGLPLNVKFLFEGEEEIGSPNLPDYLSQRADEYSCDLVISADGGMWRPNEPSLSIASKGLVSLSVKIEGAVEDLHSGRYGGTVANPIHLMAELLASLHDSDGRVTVPGFYDGIPPLSDERRKTIQNVDFDEVGYAKNLGIPFAFGEKGYTTLERLWERPTLEINGVSSGGKYTVIPHKATAHLSSRLVPGQDPKKVLAAITEFIQQQPTYGCRVTVLPDPGGVPAYTIPADHPAIRAATVALERTYPGETVLLAVIAGTLPATALFERVLGVKTLFFSFSTSDEKAHAPNENMRIKRLREGMRAWEELCRLLAEGEHQLAKVAKSS